MWKNVALSENGIIKNTFIKLVVVEGRLLREQHDA